MYQVLEKTNNVEHLRKSKMKILLSILALTVSNAAFAWGSTGHRVVGEVAQKFLTTEALVKSHQLLKGQSLAKVSNWADDIKSEPETYAHTYNWHYTTWPQDVHEHNEHTETASSGYLIKAITDQLTVLKDPKASDEKKTFALKFVVHLVGDLHMPLHVGNGTDQGGNFCKVFFHGKQTNLHSLWDEGMIDFTNLSFTEMARFISEGRSAEEVKSFRSGNLVKWAQESKNIVPTLYPANVVEPTGPMSMKTYCRKDVLPEEMPKLAFEYSYRSLPILEKRLFQAGVRLAMLLNENLK
jgi:hypothetical protein